MSTPDDLTTVATTQPWSDFFSLSAVSLPVSLSDATNRLTQNLNHFKHNYLNISLIIFFISLFFRPLSLLLLFLTALAWYYLFFSRPAAASTALDMFGFAVDDRIVAGVLGVVTVAALFYANVWVNLFVSIGISAVAAVIHGVLMAPSFAGDNAYGGLLDPQGGGYSEF